MKVYMTKVFQNGGSQAIRIPAELRFAEGASVCVFEGEDGSIRIQGSPPKGSLAEIAVKLLSGEIKPLSDKAADAMLAAVDALREESAF
jgi:virulence-associated protein VagC